MVTGVIAVTEVTGVKVMTAVTGVTVVTGGDNSDSSN